MKRVRLAAVALLVTTVASVSGVAQQARHALHHPIPGDLPLDALSPSRLTPPSANSDVAAAAGPGSAWHEAQPVGDDVAHPRSAWEAPVRELDRNTHSADGARLSYSEVFTPAIAPFKRLQAYDAVDDFGRLTVADPSLVEATVGEYAPVTWPPSEPRARFVGELNVEVTADGATPIPGVAGEQRLIRYSTSSDHALQFLRDSAGNLFVRGAVAETLRVTYVVEVPESALQLARVPPTPIADNAALAPSDPHRTTPEWLLTASRATLQAARVGAHERLNVLLARLVEYFRAFSDAELPAALQGESLYSALALGRVGACRHRAYAFVLTLIALHVPARYVGNEAHAWAEVWIAPTGWTRIDLGGWNIPLDATAPSERPEFHPANRDPFPRPASFESQYSAASARAQETRAASMGSATSAGAGASPGSTETPSDPGSRGASSGGSGATPTDGRTGSDTTSTDEHAAETTDGASGSASGGGSSPGSGSGSLAAGSVARGGSGSGTHGAPSAGLGAGDEPSDEPGRTVLALTAVRSDETAGYVTASGFVRGSMVHVEGTIHDDRGAPVAGLAVQLELLRDHRVVQSLGATVSRPDGRWDARVMLPATLEPGEYAVRAQTPGNAQHAPARAE